MYLRLLAFFFLIWVTNVLNPNVKMKVKRKIDLIVIHCTATRDGERLSKKALEEYHKSLGYTECGYHYYVRRDGQILAMRDIRKAGAHVRGYNSHSIGIAYEGGLDSDGNPKDTRTDYQRNSLHLLVSSLLLDFPDSKVVGHRDLSPDLNGDGDVSPCEWQKVCPCFDVKSEF